MINPFINQYNLFMSLNFYNKSTLKMIMNSQRKLSYETVPCSQQKNYHQGNHKNSVNLLITRKSPLQQINERIMQTTSDIRNHKISRFKNHSHHNILQQLSPKSSHKSSQRFGSSKNYNLKFNYGPQSTYFNTESQQHPKYQMREKIPSKVNFFYDNHVHLNEKNFKNYYNDKHDPIYHKAYESTDFILLSNISPYQRKISSKSKINFNYISQQQSEIINNNAKSSITYLANKNCKTSQKPNNELEKLLSFKSLKRTKSQQDFRNNQTFKKKTQDSKSTYQDNRKYEEQIFYEMDEKRNNRKSKQIVVKQKNQRKKQEQNRSKIKVITTRISQQKKPNFILRLCTQLTDKESKIIALVLIILAIVIFFIQLFS